MAEEILFRGEKHKVILVNDTFFLYRRTEKDWEVLGKNMLFGKLKNDARKELVKALSSRMPEDEKIRRVMSTGFFKK